MNQHMQHQHDLFNIIMMLHKTASTLSCSVIVPSMAYFAHGTKQTKPEMTGFAHGATVVISGLESRPDLNGTVAIVLTKGPRVIGAADTGRVCVRVPGNASRSSLKNEYVRMWPERLTLAPPLPGPPTIIYNAKLHGKSHKEDLELTLPAPSAPGVPGIESLQKLHVNPLFIEAADRFDCVHCGAQAINFITNIGNWLHVAPPDGPLLVDFAYAYCAACKQDVLKESRDLMASVSNELFAAGKPRVPTYG